MDTSPLPPNREHRTRTWTRALVPVAAIGIALGTFAVAEAATSSGTDSARDLVERGTFAADTPTTTSTRLPDDNAGSGGVAAAEPSPETFTAGTAGTVTISRIGATLTVVAVGTNPGWVATVESASGPEVEVSFRNGTARIDLEAEFEDGSVRVRVRDRSTVVSDDRAPVSVRTDNSGPGSINSGDGSDDGPNHDAVDDDSGSGGSGSGHSGSGSSGSGHSGSDDD